MLVFLSIWISSLAILLHSYFLFLFASLSLWVFGFFFVISKRLFACVVFVCLFVVMAGSAAEGTQFDTRQFDQKLSEQ